MSQKSIPIDGSDLTLEDLASIAQGARTQLGGEAFQKRIDAGANFLDGLLKEDGVVYGVTTGYGDSVTVSVPAELVAELPHRLFTYHGVGLGRHFDPEETRAILAVRLATLARGWSGVSHALLAQLQALLERDILPLIPEEGSVGASGDLTPLSYIAAVLCGEREVLYKGRPASAAEALKAEGLKPLRLRPKEGLALMNGTSVMTALACLAYRRAEYLGQLATRITALNVLGLDGNPYHFDQTLFSVKPHPGLGAVAARLRQDLHSERPSRNERRLQDRYSIRCAPHVIGVLEDSLPWLRSFIQNELNSANDNPIIDAQGQRVLHGGHFYGGHICFAMDALKAAVANLADLLDRQLALLADTKFNHGLPANLSGASRERAAINHGFKALQISVSAWTAEALKLCMPASVFSRSTECHNQDKVSLGTIAARDCRRVLELSEQAAAGVLLAAVQGVELRLRQGALQEAELGPALKATQAWVRAHSPFVDEDRALEGELRALIAALRRRELTLYG